MSDAFEELVGLLHELRDSSAGVLSRADTARRILHRVSGLQPLERRELLLEVAARAAPDVAERLEPAVDAEVTAEQLTALVDVLSELDGEQIAGLADRLGQGISPTREPAPDPDAETAAVEPGTAPEPTPEPDAEPGPEAVPEPTPDPEPEPEPEGAPVPAPAEPEPEPEPVAQEVDAPDPTRSPTTAMAAPGQREPAGERSWFTGRPLGIGDVPTEPDVIERVAGARSAGVALRVFRAALDDVTAMAGSDQARALHAIPDGWARRRALEQLVRAEGVARTDIPTLLATLSGRWPRTWVVGTLLEAGMVEADQLDEIVDPDTAGRLRRRTESRAG